MFIAVGLESLYTVDADCVCTSKLFIWVDIGVQARVLSDARSSVKVMLAAFYAAVIGTTIICFN